MARDFERFLELAVQRALQSMGETSAEVVYYYAEKHFAVRRGQISQRLEDFWRALRRLFGPGSLVVEREILRRLSEVSGVQVEEDDFLKAVEKVRRRLQEEGFDAASVTALGRGEREGRWPPKLPSV